VLSGRGLCDELITRPKESYRLCCVVVCDLETSRIGAPYIYDISNLRVKRHLQVFTFPSSTAHINYQQCGGYMTPVVRVTPLSTAYFNDSVLYTFTKLTVNLIYPSAAIWVSDGVLNALCSTTSLSVSHLKKKSVLCTMLNYFFGLIGYVITMATLVRLISLVIRRNRNPVARPRAHGPILSLFGTARFVIHIKLYLTVVLLYHCRNLKFLICASVSFLWIYLFIYLFPYSLHR